MADITVGGSSPAADYFKNIGERKDLNQAEKDRLTAEAPGILAKIKDLPPADQAVFLSILDADLLEGKLTDIENMTDKQIDQEIDNLLKIKDQVVEFFRLIAGVGNDNLLAQLLIEFANQTRKNALDERLAARDAAKADLNHQADQMDDSATSLKSSAVTAVATAVVGAVISVAASAVAGASLGGKLGHEKIHQTDLTKGSMNLDKQGLSAFSQALSGAGQSAGGMWNSGSQYASTVGQADSKEYEADGSRSAALSEVEKSTGDMARDVQQALTELAQKIIEFLKERKDAKVEQQGIIAKGIAV